MAAERASSDVKDDTDKDQKTGHDTSLRFWSVLISLCAMTFLAALETTVITTALPTILERLAINGEYAWVNCSFFLTSAIFQPLFGQLADIFGRRLVTLASVVIYAVGCVVAGAAHGSAALIAGRAVQGIGSGGINVMSDIIISDLVAQRSRGYYLALLMVVNGIGTLFGPFLGGVMAQPGTDTWRWIFWMNVPLCAMILVLLYVCLQFNRPRLPSYVQELKSLDFIGMALLAASTVLILLGFTWAGTKYSWQAAQILVPILGGISGLVAFWIFERSSYPTRPLVPAYMLTQRTAILISAVTFCYAITLYWIIFTVPTYFQAVQLSTAAAAGLKTLPFAIAIIPVCVVAGILLTRWGRYKPMHVVGCAVTAIAVGLMSSMDRDTHIALWILYLVLGALGMGTLMNTMLPGFQATLTSETEQAAGTAAWNFIRSFGYIWGFGASTAIFNSVASAHADMVSDVPLQTELRAGRTLAFAVAAQIKSFGDPVSDQLHSVLTLSIQRTLLLGIMFPCLALLFSLFEQEIALKTTIESDFGLTEDGTRSGSVETTWSKKSESV